MKLLPEVTVDVSPYREEIDAGVHKIGDGTVVMDFDQVIHELNQEIDMLSSHADQVDLMVAAASGILCGAMDVFLVGGFDLDRGRGVANDGAQKFVKQVAKLQGCKKDDLKACVEFLERNYGMASDGNTPGFGGGLHHHLRDFAHHPTIVGLVFSLLTQFTEKSYGTDEAGNFLILNVEEKSKKFIGEDVPHKILNGTIIWFFHLVSDMVGSGGTVMKSGGTGIPGPILALAKELSVLPMFRDLKVKDNTLSVMISKLFNGTLLAQHDEHGRIIKDTAIRFDLRGELGVAVELGRQALPVVANECIVRVFYMIRRLAMEIKRVSPRKLDDFKKISWNAIKPAGNPTIARMLTVSTGVFVAIDVGEAVATQKYWVNINYVGVGRFALAIGGDVSWCLKQRKVKEVRKMYEDLKRNVFRADGDGMFGVNGKVGDKNYLGLTLEETEILYNLEFYVACSDVEETKLLIQEEKIVALKMEWLKEWRQLITAGFESFTQVKGAEMHWYTRDELKAKIAQMEPRGIWFRLVLLEVMLFEPYFTLSVIKNKKGKEIPSPKYKDLQNSINGYKSSIGDAFLEENYAKEYYPEGYIQRLRRCNHKVLNELNEDRKAKMKVVAVTAAVVVATVLTAGVLAPTIAVALVGVNFAGLHGAALTSACLAYMGGGAVAAGGAGMAGGTISIVGGGAVLGTLGGLGAGGAVSAANAAGLNGRRNTISQTAKLLIAMREIFLNDEQDVDYCKGLYEQYCKHMKEVEKGIGELQKQAKKAGGEEKGRLKKQSKSAEESLAVMKIARKSMARFISSFELGLQED